MKRLSSIDGLRGLVVILMVMHHSLDAWVLDSQRHGFIWRSLRHLGGLPAPGFMLLAGVSAALVAGRERNKGLSHISRAWLGIRRGLYVLGIAFAFRVAMFIIDRNHWDEWAIIFRVDILNCMGVALALVTAVCAFAPTRRSAINIALVLTALALLPAPLIYGHTITWPTIFVGNYIAGSGPLELFPLFPWLAFISAGYAVGEIVVGALAANREPPNQVLAATFWPVLALGLCVFSGGIWLGWMPFHLYPPHDYWNCSPIFMSMRIGIQLVLLGLLALWWKNDPMGKRGALLQLLGRHSLLVYLVHLEFIYGRVAYTIQHRLSLGMALWGAALIVTCFTGVCLGLEWLQAWRARRTTDPRGDFRAAPLGSEPLSGDAGTAPVSVYPSQT